MKIELEIHIHVHFDDPAALQAAIDKIHALAVNVAAENDKISTALKEK